MAFANCYQAPELTLWQGRQDAPPDSSFFQIINLLDLSSEPENAPQPAFALLGFCCDEGIRRNLGRIGAAEGPYALRTALAKLPIHKHDVKLYDAGNISCRDGDLEAAQTALGEAVAMLLTRGYTPIVIGGGHEMAYGHYQGIATQINHENLGIINLDTHFDMRPILPENKGSSGTPFLQIANAHTETSKRFDYHCIGIQPYGNTSQLFITAQEHNAKTLTTDEMQINPDTAKTFVQRAIQDNDRLYLSLCLDVFSAAYAPGVSAPQAFGLAPWNIIPIVRQIAASGKVLSYDIAELSPKYDIDGLTARLAANFVHEIIHHHVFAK